MSIHWGNTIFLFPGIRSRRQSYPRLFMANKKEKSFYKESPKETLVAERTKPIGGLWFTLNDIHPNRWRKRLHEFRAWIETQLMKPYVDPYKGIEELCCRMIGTMKGWYQNIRAFKQDELHHLETTARVLGVLQHMCIGDIYMHDSKTWREFFEIKCCSLKAKDLEKHYHRMMQRFYVLDGLNDPSRKNTYVAYLPQ